MLFQMVETMKPGGNDNADIGKIRGLGGVCGSTGVNLLFDSYTRPMAGSLAQVKIGNFLQTSLADG